MLVRIKLDGTTNEPVDEEDDDPMPTITDFLTTHPSAKIVVVVDTHCLQETGSFIWKGDKPEHYEPCTIEEVMFTSCATISPDSHML